MTLDSTHQRGIVGAAFRFFVFWMIYWFFPFLWNCECAPSIGGDSATLEMAARHAWRGEGGRNYRHWPQCWGREPRCLRLGLFSLLQRLVIWTLKLQLHPYFLWQFLYNKTGNIGWSNSLCIGLLDRTASLDIASPAFSMVVKSIRT